MRNEARKLRQGRFRWGWGLVPIALAAACHAVSPGGQGDMGPAGSLPDLNDNAADTALDFAPSEMPLLGIDPMRSIAVTDLPTLESRDGQGNARFSLERVLGQILTTGGASNPGGAVELYQRIFDTNNLAAAGLFPDGQHCDDERDVGGQPTLNGFPLECPRQERVLADLTKHHPFCTGTNCDPYSPIGLFNRFDLAAAAGTTCGEYRIVFGKGVGRPPLLLVNMPTPNMDIRRTLLIFEAILPNPHPDEGVAGCAPIVEFWVGLSAIDDPAERAAELDRFFFTGLPGFDPR